MMMLVQRNLSDHLPTILCCICSTAIQANTANICSTCLKNETDISEKIPKEYIIQQCRGCLKWQRPPWIAADLESKELLALCLKKISGLQHIKLVDAVWIWTEPHSKRLQLKITIQKEVLSKVVIQQALLITFIVRNLQCDECQSIFTNQSWKAVVQVRQKVDHKRTFYFLEQLILKYQAHAKASNIETQPNGVDFFFLERNHAQRFVDFLEECVPLKLKSAKKLISSDNHSNTHNYKFTYSVEIAPVCKDDLVVLPTKLARSLGNIHNLCLVTSVSSSIHVVDPFTLQTAEIDCAKYWRHPFQGVRSVKALKKYTVLDINPCIRSQGDGKAYHVNKKTRLVEVEVVRECDFGVNDTRFFAVTHLGNVLHVGDTVLCYDLTSSVFNDNDIKPLEEVGITLPDVVLVRKKFSRRTKKRNWKLKQLEEIHSGLPAQKNNRAADDSMEYESFLDELEDDQAMRGQINIYKEQAEAQDSSQPDDDEGMQASSIPLSEMLDDLTFEKKSSEPITILSVEEASKVHPWELEEL
uniref:60S ribosomal export protein NMD3 n=1 Tax=Albugo laibachii Nc14 TaxID=890382 RepID=F0W429_9STRA|nr:60S ribosomal export protein NMD3 putative [Albugo laibachii Nc14]|eukprot:CCA15826.1 60S ribosomal export protein NMD3 putative [Albugo laibachii Nc14]